MQDNNEPKPEDNPFLTPNNPPEEAPVVPEPAASEPASDEPMAPLQEASTPEIQQPDPFAKPPKSKKPLILVIALFVLLLGAAAVAYFLFLQPKTPVAQTSTEKTQTETTENKVLTTEAIVDGVKSSLTGTDVSDIPTDGATLYFRLDGNKFLTNIDTGATILGVASTLDDQASLDAEQGRADAVLEAKGLTLNDLSSIVPEYTATVNFWTNDDIVCRSVASTTTTGQAGPSYNLNVSCAYLSDYAKTVTAVKPFYDAYKLANDHYTDNLQFSVPTVKDSKTAGYKFTHIPLSTYGAAVGGFSGLFYQTPDAAWHYFHGSQSPLLCSQYDTDDIKKAYLGEVCYDADSKESTVKL